MVFNLRTFFDESLILAAVVITQLTGGNWLRKSHRMPRIRTSFAHDLAAKPLQCLLA